MRLEFYPDSSAIAVETSFEFFDDNMVSPALSI